MTRGRRPTPTPLRLLRGNPQHRPIPDEPKGPSGGAALMPPWLRVLDSIAAGLNQMTLTQLRSRARDLRIDGRSTMSRDELITAIQSAHIGPREAGWSELAPMLETMRVITAADVHALAMVVDAYVDYIELRRIVEDEGQTYATEGRYGLQVKRRPEVEHAARRWEQVLKGLIEFGMTPASRSKVGIVPADATGGLAGMMA